MKLNVNITLAVLCFHNEDETAKCLRALVGQELSLAHLVDHVHIAIHDNSETNIGQGAGRNRLIDKALRNGASHIFFLDGDIQVVPGSVYLMLSHMLSRPRLGCLCPHPANQTTDPDKATRCMTAIGPIHNDVRTACTGYALYDARVFQSGIRFEESGPFAGPGWGLEDDDMYFQLKTSGWDVDYFTGITYLQRQTRSSWPYLKELGFDVVKVFEDRKEFFINKWRGRIDPSFILNVKAQHLGGLGV